MSIDLARTMLSAYDGDRLGLIYVHEDALVWDEYGDEVEQFNRIIARYAALPTARIDRSDRDFRITYRDASVTVPLERDRQDHLRAVLALAKVAREDLAFRMCVDTGGNSEFAFMMLPPVEWHALEREFGTEVLDRCFLSVGDSCEELFEMLSGDEDEEELSHAQIAAESYAEALEATLDDRGASVSVSHTLDEDGYYRLRIETSTDAERDELFNNASFAQIFRGIDSRLRQDGLILECIVIESEETIEREWGGIHFESLFRAYSPHVWINRRPEPQVGKQLDTGALLELLRKVR